MDLDIVTSLTEDGPQFEGKWCNFLFNTEAALYLREKKAKAELKDEDIVAILAAGQRYTGSGWSTVRASRRLFELSGVGVIKGTIQRYRDCWLYSRALLTDIDLPQVELEAELAAAAFSLVGWLEHPEEPAQEPTAPVSVEDDSEEEYRFIWDTPTVTCPKELLVLWGRAKDGEKKVSIKDILEGLAPLEGLPTKPAENNLLPAWKKPQDTTFKVLSQGLLHVLRVWGHRFQKKVSVAVDMQLF